MKLREIRRHKWSQGWYSDWRLFDRAFAALKSEMELSGASSLSEHVEFIRQQDRRAQEASHD